MMTKQERDRVLNLWGTPTSYNEKKEIKEIREQIYNVLKFFCEYIDVLESIIIEREIRKN